MPGKSFSLEIQPVIPPAIGRLEELANNLLYSWDREVRGLFYRLDASLWENCGHNPKLFLRRIEQDKLELATRDSVFVQDYEKVLSFYTSYMEIIDRSHCSPYINCENDLISYSCAEFGLYESFPIYSGGLGILAGDYCKAMSDLNVPFVAVGILYRQGYFHQTVDGKGNQIAHYIPSNFDDLPVSPAHNAQGEEIEISVQVSQRSIHLKVWVARIGHINLLLLDSDIPANSDSDRRITYQLYGGNAANRLIQEFILGIGGVRAQRALGLNPTVWHINEGHAVLQVLERCRELVHQGEADFYTALEAIAANTVFTTHTPVAAGHDIFPAEMIEQYLSGIVHELGISMHDFLKLGESPMQVNGFNMTALGLRCARFRNGVSRIHGRMASSMEQYVWPQIPVQERMIRYVDNGIHVPTFLAREWANYFDNQLGGGWRRQLLNEKYWNFIENIPDYAFWSRRQALKSRMLESMINLVSRQHRRNGASKTQIRKLTRYLKPQATDVLTIGFARRFATYKRATLIFLDRERLARLLNNPLQPIVILFAGKAHPDDALGQALLRKVCEIAREPEFEGKIVFVENYDISVARKLVSGVDVWLNTPEYPLEASGTSGQKAGINGVLNLSVLDGWWAAGYNGKNGWAITPHESGFSTEFKDKEEANELLDVLEHQVVPLYYNRNGRGFSSEWIKMSKESMRSLIPRFNSQRMVMTYLTDFYAPAIRQGNNLGADDHAKARQLAQWKRQVIRCWDKVSITRIDIPATKIRKGATLDICVAVELNGLAPEAITIECLFYQQSQADEYARYDCQTLHFDNFQGDGRALFRLAYIPVKGGLQYYRVRCYPWHEHLSEPFELGCMLWLE